MPDGDGDKPKSQKFNLYPIGFFFIHTAGMQTAEDKLYLFVRIDRTATFAIAQRIATADRKATSEVLRHILEAVPYQTHTISGDSGRQFVGQPCNRNIIRLRRNALRHNLRG